MSLAAYPVRRTNAATETLLRIVLGLMLALSCVSFIEPSPYEFLFFLLIPVALLNGLTVTRTTMTLFFLLFAIVAAQFLSLVPYFGHRGVDENNLTPSMYTVYTVYLYLSALLFALIFSQETNARVGLTLKAYAFSCVFAGCWGILSFVNVMGIGDREPIEGRIAGPFKDPNVLGSYCILGVLVIVQSILLERRYTFFKIVGAGIAFVGGVFFSMSRGSIGAMMLAFVFLLTTTYFTSERRIRRRIVGGLLVMVALAGLGGAVIATRTDMVENIAQRAKLTQEYDGGETGRFGNQKRSIPMLIESPLGFGPFRFPVYFGLQPHNSYIGAFADAGWIGGFAFLILAISTCFLGVRLAIIRSPYRRHAQVVAPAAAGFFLQALQIDIDHWRFVFLLVGLVWGMESARRALGGSRESESRAESDSAAVANISVQA